MTSLCHPLSPQQSRMFVTAFAPVAFTPSSLPCGNPTSRYPSSPLRLQDFGFPYHSLVEIPGPPRYAHNPLCARHAPRPRRNLLRLALCLILIACCLKENIGFRSICFTGLNRFTLSHCGSHTPLPTLESALTSWTPRLCTGCLLGFTGLGLSPS